MAVAFRLPRAAELARQLAERLPRSPLRRRIPQAPLHSSKDADPPAGLVKATLGVAFVLATVFFVHHAGGYLSQAGGLSLEEVRILTSVLKSPIPLAVATLMAVLGLSALTVAPNRVRRRALAIAKPRRPGPRHPKF